MTDETPEALRRHALDRLLAAPGEHGSPFRTPQLATVAPDGAPELRTVVLRAVDPAGPVLTVHADRRSAKVVAIAADPRVAVLAWDAAEQLQLRLVGTARLHAGDAVARAEWDALGTGARAAYAFAAPPGTPVDPAEAGRRLPEEAARENFCVLRIEATRLDVLRLGARGAQFRVRAAPDGPAERIGP